MKIISMIENKIYKGKLLSFALLLVSGLFANGTYVIDFDGREKHEEFSDLFGKEIYSYEVEVDLNGLEAYFEENGLIEGINTELELYTDYKDYAEARENISDVKTEIYTTDDRLFGFHTSYTIDFEENGEEVTHLRLIEWVANDVLTEEVEIEAPKKYIKAK